MSHEKRLRCSFSCQDTGSPLDYLKIAADQPLLLAYSREKGHSRNYQLPIHIKQVFRDASEPGDEKEGLRWEKEFAREIFESYFSY